MLVVGAGNSAGEISVELARAGAEVTLAVRTGATAVPREIVGIPIQYLALTIASLPRKVQQRITAMIGGVSALVRGAAVLPPAPDARCPNVPLIGFHLADALRAGTIRLKGGLAEFTTSGVRFLDGSEQPFDTVILATGYRAAVGLLPGAIRLDDCGFGLRRNRVVSVDQSDLYFVGHNYDIRGGLFNIGRDATRTARYIRSARDNCRTSTGTPQRSSER